MGGVKVTLIGIASVIVMIALAFVMELGGLEWKKFFAPKHAAVEREVFKETRSFNEAKKQELLKYHHEWMTAEGTDKKAIEFTIRHTFADYDTKKLSYELASFLEEVKYK